MLLTSLDVIGHVVEKDVVKETIVKGKKSKVTNLTLKDLENNRLHCSLWNDFAVRFHQFMDTHNSSEPPVMILQLVRLKKNSYLGVMGVSNIFNGTKMLLNADIPNVAEYKVKMDDTERESTEGFITAMAPD
ncbi:hypothetical protein P8452_41081 [Trifolium repens]|nr:hypothetical protein P8452_41081 [Trifolium repens]